MSGERGFTLIEALVAFAILALMLVALYGAVGTSLNGIARSARYEGAILIAEGRLAELTALRALPPTLEGVVEGSGHRWRIEPIAPQQPDLFETSISPFRQQKIKLTIAWSEHGGVREIAIERQLLLWREPR